MLDNTTLTLTSLLPSNDTLALSTSSPVTPIRTADFNLEYYRSWHNSAFCNEVMPRPNPNRKRRSIKRQLWRIRLADFWQMIFTII